MHKIVIFNFRIGNFLFRKKVPLIPKFIDYLNRLIFSVWIPTSATIGTNFILGYGGLGVVIHNRAIIGDNCHVDQNVTIGGTSKKIEVPIIGNKVYIGAGAKILGPIKIGDNVVIGANAVVLKNVPNNCVVAGVPAKVIKTNIDPNNYF